MGKQTKARLGKGLGALFPQISVMTPMPAGKPAEKPAEEPTKPTAEATKKAAPRQTETTAAGAARTSACNDAKTGASNTANNTEENASGAQNGSKPSRKRMAIPDWNSIAHPSDFFFSSTESETSASHATDRSTSRGVNHVPRAQRADEPTGRSAAPSHANHTSAANSVASTPVDAPAIAPVPGAYLAELDVSDIRPNAEQPRAVFNQDELHDLADSIAEVGVLEPIVVRRRPAPGSHHELIMGERRWRASRLAGKKTIPAIVRTTSNEHMLRDALLENLQRVQLNPLEEAAAYQQMMHDFGLTQEQLSKSISKSRPQIANTLRLLQLPGAVQKRVEAGELTAGHARALLSLRDPDAMVTLADRIVAEGLSVRAVERIVAQSRGSRSKERRAKKANYWAASDLSQRLGSRFGTTVNIHGTEKHGTIEITFTSKEDLDRIARLLGSDVQDGE